MELLKNFELHGFWDKPIYNEGDSDSFFSFGNSYGASGYLFGILEAVFYWIGFGYRRIKLSNLKKKILPQYSASWICPQCLFVDKRAILYHPRDSENGEQDELAL